jgi:hypothetical protein
MNVLPDPLPRRNQAMPSFHRPLLTVAVLLAAGPAAARSDDGVAFFEKKIRPVLVEHCVRCHSDQGKSPKGGLRVDTRAGLRKGGDSGPALVPGKPQQSLLLKALRYSDESLRMPPRGKLPDAVVRDFERWIALGAPDPRTGSSGPAVVGSQAARGHWAFQPIHRPALPAVKDAAWPRTPVDRFLLARLEAKDLTPSPQADRRTLIRRLYFDLLGLPPAMEAVDAFLADARPDAYERLVDRLLASPAYGERWGRHWLDVARYADTKDGVLMYGDDRVRPYAYTYRDYVIRAFNEDLPLDRFVHEQLAADRVAPREEPWRLAAMGFLTLGRMFDNNVHDILDDRIDVVTRGLLGLTVSCARCHDHKYDPIPQADYYSLYGVFAGSEAPLELPLLEPVAANPARAAFEKKAAAKRQALRAFLDSQYTLLLKTARERVADYLVRAATTKPDPLETAIFFLSLAPDDLRPQIVARWRLLLERRARADDPVFGPWHDLMRLSEPFPAADVETLRSTWKRRPAGTGKGQLNPLVLAALQKAPLARRADVARAYGGLLRDIGNKADDPARRQLLALVAGPDSPGYFPRKRTREYMSRGEKDSFGGKVQELDRLAVQAGDAAPPRAMVLVDAEEVTEPRVFVRGDPSRPGPRVPRQFLRVVAGEQRSPFHTGSGRLDLARAITAGDNPLTARVLVNRVWMHHFGEPLVDSPSDFGLRTAPPTHPELLDHLARELIEGGWSLKRLHRTLLLSSVYRQASRDRLDCRRLDPDNRLLWRMNRRRLEFEAMRDSLLAVARRLDTRMFGRPVNVAGDPGNRRRTVYGLVDRQDLPGVFRAFDFAAPDSSVERRPRTTVPQQALFGMNSPFVLEQARALAARVGSEPEGARRVEALYRVVLARRPTQAETRLALDFVVGVSKGNQLGAWEQLAQVLLMTNEVMFVD